MSGVCIKDCIQPEKVLMPKRLVTNNRKVGGGGGATKREERGM